MPSSSKKKYQDHLFGDLGNSRGEKDFKQLNSI